MTSFSTRRFMTPFVYKWRRFMYRLRRTFNARNIRRRVSNYKANKVRPNPVEFIRRPSDAFFNIGYNPEVQISEDIIDWNSETVQQFFEENLERPSFTYQERGSTSSDVFRPQMAFEGISEFVSDCVVGQSTKDAVSGLLATAVNAESSFANVAEALVQSSKTLNDLVASLKTVVDKDPVKYAVNETGAAIYAGLHSAIEKYAVSNATADILATASFLTFIGAFLYYVSNRSKSTLTIMTFCLAVTVYFNYTSISAFMTRCGQYLPNFSMVPQAGVDFDGLIQAITLLLFTLNVKGCTITTLPKNILEHLKSFKTIRESLKDIVVFLMTLLEQILDYASLSQYLPSWAKFLNVSDPEVKLLFRQLDAVNHGYQKNAFPLNKSNGNLIQDLQKKIVYFLRTLPSNPTTNAIRDCLKSELPKVNKLLEVFRAAKLTDDGKRIEPVFALFAGAPGNFKSQMIELLCAELQMRTLDPVRLAEAKQDHFRYVFKREQANVYWDGYKDPHIVIFDDIGQFKTCVQNIDNEFSSILSAVNELPLPLHMASVDAKGSTYFNARFILGTTNFPVPEMENIRSREAYNRRVAYAYFMVPRPEFCTPETAFAEPLARKLNKANPALPRGAKGKILTHPKHHSMFLRYDPHDPSKILGTYNFDQIVDQLVADYNLKSDYFLQKSVEVDEIYDRLEEEEFEEAEELWARMTPIDELESGICDSKTIAAPQMADVIEPSTFDDLCGSTDPEVDERDTANLFVDDLYITKAYQALFAENIDISKKIEIIKFEYLKEFGEQLDGSDHLIFLKACVATKTKSLLPYFATSVNMKLFARKFAVRRDLFMSNVESVNVFTKDFANLDVIQLQSIWSGAAASWKSLIYTSAYGSYRTIIDFFHENRILILSVLGFITASAVAIPTALFTAYGSYAVAGQAVNTVMNVAGWNKYPTSDEIEENDKPVDADLFDMPVATDEFTSVPVASEPQVKGKETVKPEIHSSMGERFVGSFGRLTKKSMKRTGNFSNPYDIELGPQMAIDADKQAYDLASRINGSMLLLLHLVTGDKVARLGHALVICDRVAVTPKHYFSMLTAKVKAGIIPRTANIRLSFRSTIAEKHLHSTLTIEDFLEPSKWIFTEKLTSNDQALFVMPPDSSRKFRSIMDRIAPLELHNENKIRSGFLMGFDDTQNNLSTFKLEPIVGQLVTEPLIGSYKIDRAYSYYANTEYGDCGTPMYVHCRSSAKAKIFGIHAAGVTATGRGISSALVREFLEEALVMVPQIAKITTNTRDFDLQTPMPFAQNQFTLAYESNYFIPDSGKSKILKSELYGMWGDAVMKPVNLKRCVVNGEIIDVKLKAYSKTAIGEWCLPEKIMKDVEDCYFSDMVEVSVIDVEKRLYSFEEAIIGLEDDTGFGAIARNTSPGFPYICDPAVKRAGPAKRYWFGVAETYDLDNPRVKALYQKCMGIIERATKGIRSEHVFVDCLKDERLPIAKVDSGKTRMINSGPLDLLIIMRMYFGAFANWFTKNRVLNGSAIGVNPYSAEWDDMARTLRKFGTGVPNVGAGDYSGYDGSQKPIVHNAILNIINRWYNDSPTNQLVRTVLWAEVVQAKHISGSIMYTAVMSLPSGHALTALINTIYNGLAFRYCWYRAVNYDKTLLIHFLKNVYAIFLGDDNTYCVHPDYVDRFNDINLEGWMKEFGLVYTNETKTGTMSALRKLEEISFLKRKFRKEELLGRYVAPLDISVVLEIPYWTKKKDSIAITEDNCKLSISELSLHGEEIYNKWAPVIQDAAKTALGTNIRVDSYSLALTAICAEDWQF